MSDGDKVVLDKVLFISDDSKVTVGNPLVEGAQVVATAKGVIKGKKIIVLRYKAKTRSTRKTGHRHQYTELAIDSIVNPAESKN